MPEVEQVLLSDELLAVMRDAARKAIEARENFITPRALLSALLDDPYLGPALANVVDRARLEAFRANGDELDGGERPLVAESAPIARYDTLAFKTPDGKASVWLDRDAYDIFIEGMHRVDDRYFPKQLAFGLAAEAIRAPGVLTALRIEPGALTDAIYKL